MSTRSRDAARLAQLLTEHTGIPIKVTFHGNAKDHHGGWHVEWTDGPTVASMRRWVATVRDLHDLRVLPVRTYDRGSTDLAEACALLSWLGERPDEARNVSGGMAAREAHGLTEHPEVVDEDTLRRARALLLLGVGMVDGEVVRQIRQHALAGGWSGVLEWLDGSSTGAETPGVVSLDEARRRRANGPR